MMFLILPLGLHAAAPERKEVRLGNKEYKEGDYSDATLNYKRALDKSPQSSKVKYNLGNALYKLIDSSAMRSDKGKQQLEEVRKLYEPLSETAETNEQKANALFNIGNTYLQEYEWDKAIECYQKTLRLTPNDMAAKENLFFAELMKQNPPQEQPQNQNQDQEKNNDQNKDKNKGKQDKQQDQDRQDQNQNNDSQNKDRQNQDQQQESEGNISKEEAQQILQAIEQQEKETQDKVKKEKAKAARQRSSDKNW
jgi:tetratricopeptide (TPR) repeat protein